MIIKGYACHFNRRNSNGEIVDAKSFDAVLERAKKNALSIPINYNHDSADILGRVLNFYPDNNGLYIVAELNEEVASVKDKVMPLIKDGTLDRFSTEGFVAKNDIERIDKNTYKAKNFELTAVAIVPLPADLDAKFSLNSQDMEGLSIFNSFEPEKGVSEPETAETRRNLGLFII